MKALKNQFHLNYTVALPLIIISFLLYQNVENMTYQILLLSGIPVMACCLLLLYRIRTCAQSKQDKSTITSSSSLAKIIFFQSLIYLMYPGYLNLLTTLIPHTHTIVLSQPADKLFPILLWTASIVLALQFKFIPYKVSQVTRFSDLLITRLSPDTETSINSHFSNHASLCIAFNLCIFTLCFAHCIFTAPLNFGWNIYILVTTLLITFIFSLMIHSGIFDQRPFKKIPLEKFFIVSSLSIGILVGLMLSISATQSTPHLTQPHWLKPLNNLPQTTTLSLAKILWWLSWLPISALYLTNHSRQLNTRWSLFCFLILPCIVTFLPIQQIVHLLKPYQNNYLFLGAFFTLLILLNTKKNKPSFVSNQTHQPKQIKHRTHTRFQKKTTLYYALFLTIILINVHQFSTCFNKCYSC